MAGPGGGPPRRSHTKSRKGCDSCKRRHIRCDENFPQCRNCTKHKVRCPYNDMPLPEDRSTTPDKPDLMWTPEIQAAIEHWQNTGIFPFPNLRIYPEPDPQYLSTDDLRLVYHLASICSQLDAMDANNFTIWTRQIPTVIGIAARNPFVMHSLLAFAAMHIAYLTGCPLVGNLEYEHRGVALKGLQQAIGSFSRETSDAVLAASLVLSWQATDWRSWTQLMQGTLSVMDAMETWKNESLFVDFINDSRTFPTAPPSPALDHKSSQPSQEDNDAYQRTLQQLQSVEAYLKHSKQEPLTKSMGLLISFLKGSRKVSLTYSVVQQFDRLRPLRTYLFWLPVEFLQKNGASPNALVAMAQYYMVALFMERVFPEIGAAYFGSLCIGPVEDIARRLFAMNQCNDPNVVKPLSMMELPIETVKEFRSRMGWSQPVRTPSFPTFSHPSMYGSEAVPVPPVTGPYMTYDSSAYSYSTESLPLLNAEPSAPNSAISPLSLSSPFPNPHYLNIPSPSYGAGGLSPASSTFEGSIAYSDNDDFGPFDMSGVPDGLPMPGSSNHNFGVGFVPPIQTVWM